MKLTKRQIEELRRLATGPQTTRNRDGGGRRIFAKVQSNLRALGLARFCEEDGSEPPLSLFMIAASYGNPRPQCRITDKGRAYLLPLDSKPPRRR